MHTAHIHTENQEGYEIGKTGESNAGRGGRGDIEQLFGLDNSLVSCYYMYIIHIKYVINTYE